MIRVEEARPDHIPPILADIRPEDLREWYAGTGSPDMVRNLRHVFEEGRYARVAVDEDGLGLCFWGADPLEDGTASVWLFATTPAEKRARAIHRHLKPELDAIVARWPLLKAWSDSRNLEHHRWLTWLGFSFEREAFHGALGMPFKLYIRRSPCA